MFVVYKRYEYEGDHDHKYFNHKENAEEYARDLIPRVPDCAEVFIEEIQTED